MFPVSCSKTTRVVVFILFGSTLTFLVQYIMFQPANNHDSVIKMTQPMERTPIKIPPVVKSPGHPVLESPPGLPVPGVNLDHAGGGSQALKQIPLVNQPAQVNNNFEKPGNIPSSLTALMQNQYDFSQIPEALLQQLAQRLSQEFPNGNMVPQGPVQMQGPPPNGYGVPPMQNFPPNGNNMVQGFAPGTNMVPGTAPGTNMVPGFVPGMNMVQGPAPGMTLQGYIPNGVQPGAQIQNIPPHYLMPQINAGQGNIQNLAPGIQYPMPPTPGEPQVPEPQNQGQEGPETKILRWDGNGWKQLHGFCAGNMNLKRTVLKSPVGSAIIYIHDLKDDRWVSGSLKSHGLWDLPDVQAMIDNLRSDPDLGFIDIGSHVGTFSLVAAIMGHKVVAVDPLVANVIRFCKSVQDNKFTDKITLFYTAISDGYKKVSFKRDIGNIGGTRIQVVAGNVNTSNIYDPNFIDTVRLDDLLPHIPFKKTFIKLDVEEHEYEVITSGVKFFQELDVRGILMEWMWQKTGKNGMKLRDYLLGLHFKPYYPNGKMELNIQQYNIWPNDVLWKKI